MTSGLAGVDAVNTPFHVPVDGGCLDGAGSTLHNWQFALQGAVNDVVPIGQALAHAVVLTSLNIADDRLDGTGTALIIDVVAGRRDGACDGRVDRGQGQNRGSELETHREFFFSFLLEKKKV